MSLPTVSDCFWDTEVDAVNKSVYEPYFCFKTGIKIKVSKIEPFYCFWHNAVTALGFWSLSPTQSIE